jgi:hypothetical protein
MLPPEAQTSPDMPVPQEGLDSANAPDQLPEAGISQDEMTIRANLAEHINGLPDDAKQFIQAWITPEFTMLMNVLFGQTVGGFFQQFENPEIILIPMERSEVQGVLQGQQQQQPQQSQTTPPMPQEMPQQGATSEMMPPPMA